MKELFTKNKKIVLLIVALLITKSFIQLFEFPSDLKLSILRILLFIAAIVIALISIKNWKFKMMTVIFIFGFSILQGELNIWKIPAKKQVKMIETNHSKLFNQLKNQEATFTVLLSNANELNLLGSSEAFINQENKALILKLFNESEIFQIDKTKSEILFVYDRFIDNGYGLLYSENANFENDFWKNPFRINGLEITSISKVSNNWYRVSFT